MKKQPVTNSESNLTYGMPGPTRFTIDTVFAPPSANDNDNIQVQFLMLMSVRGFKSASDAYDHLHEHLHEIRDVNTLTGWIGLAFVSQDADGNLTRWQDFQEIDGNAVEVTAGLITIEGTRKANQS